ncbi:MAG: peptidoglycan-binding protein [bacterium]|nr:peptidoglycan-binding protein [bacterium]
MKIKTIYIKILAVLFFVPVLTLAGSPGLELTRSLRLGTQGEDVKSLQKFLAKDSTIYPEGLATGYFGLKTQVAVKKWQQKYGIEPVGIVGPKTITKIKEISLTKQAEPTSSKVTPLDPQNITETVVQPVIVNDTVPPTATLNVKVPAPTKIYIGTNPSEEVTAVYEYGLNINYGSIKEVSTQYFSSLTGVYIENLIPSTTYQVRAKITDRAGNTGYSQNHTFITPGIDQAPLLSSGPNVVSSNKTPSTSVAVSWETNIPCNGTLYYDTTSAFGSSVRSDITTTDHNAVITGLSSGITYIYKVTCATTKKTFQSDNYLFTATSSTSSIINSPTLASVLESLKGLLEKMITLIKE